MEIKLFKNWWLLTLKGILSIVFGLLALIVPAILNTTGTIIKKEMVIVFGIIVILSGILLIYGAITHRRTNKESKYWMAEGIFDIIVGFVIFYLYSKSILATRLAFNYIIALWVLVMGILQVINTFRLKNIMERWWVVLITGIISIMFAVLICVDSFDDPIINITVIAFFVILLGILFIVISKGIKNIYTK